ncbi:MAG: YdcF family protein [Flavobacteriales bacterium]
MAKLTAILRMKNNRRTDLNFYFVTKFMSNLNLSDKWDAAKHFLRKLSGKIIRALLWLAIPLFFIFLFRIELATGLANWMVCEDEPQAADAILVLGGNTYDRARKAQELFDAGFAPKIITSGANSASPDSIATGNQLSEAELTKMALIKRGIDKKNILSVNKGTSTFEESVIHAAYAKKNGIKKLIIVSDKMHLRRIKLTFEKTMKTAGVELILIGVSNTRFDEFSWWKTEEGLLMMVSECLKYVYYVIKY